MENKDFCAFILTHGRPKKVYTLESLKKSGYTGPYYIVIDNEDKAADEYYKIYGDKVIMFDKKAIAKTFDEGDNFEDRRAIIYARNACFKIAQDLGYKYFIELDDDYTQFQFRIDKDFRYRYKQIGNLDKVLDIFLEYYKSINAKSIAMAQGGDFIGGVECTTFAHGFKPMRKCMNTFICSTDRPFQFVGRINEDVNTYTLLGSRGELFFSIPNVLIVQVQTQHNSGGMTELYLDSGTYIKSFYSVMYSPSSVHVALMGNRKNYRLHHQMSWPNAVPVIIDEKFRKKRLE